MREFETDKNPSTSPTSVEDIWETEEAQRFLKALEELEEPQPLSELESGFGFL